MRQIKETVILDTPCRPAGLLLPPQTGYFTVVNKDRLRGQDRVRAIDHSSDERRHSADTATKAERDHYRTSGVGRPSSGRAFSTGNRRIRRWYLGP